MILKRAKEIIEDWGDTCPPYYVLEMLHLKNTCSEKCDECKENIAIAQAQYEENTKKQLQSFDINSFNFETGTIDKIDEVNRIKIVIVDDNGGAIKSILHYINDKRISVVGIAMSYENGLREIKEKSPDVAIIDINLKMSLNDSNKDGLHLAKEIQKTTKVIIITSMLDEDLVDEAYDKGAIKFIKKVHIPFYLERDIIEIATGISDALLVSKRYKSNIRLRRRGIKLGILSPKEQEVYEYLEQRKTVNEIAQIMNIATKSAINYKNSILNKTGYSDIEVLIE